MPSTPMERASVKAIAANARKNDSGTIVYGGTIVSSRWGSKSLEHVGFDSGKTGSVIPAALTDAQIAQNTFGSADPATPRPRTHVYKPYSAGNYAKMVAGEYIIFAQSPKIAGVANTVIQGGGDSAVNHRSINRLATVRSTFVWKVTYTAPAAVGNQAIYGNPKHTPETTYTRYQTTQTLDTTIANESMGPDDASQPTRAIPGEFVWIETGKHPTLKDYPAKLSL